jgi:hypothetical protein
VPELALATKVTSTEGLLLAMEMLMVHNLGHQQYYKKESLEYITNFDLPSFSSHPHFENFLEWITEVENFLKYMCIPENRKVKVVALKLKGGASAWWEWLKFSRSREGKLPSHLGPR